MICDEYPEVFNIFCNLPIKKIIREAVIIPTGDQANGTGSFY
jgi:hypothetical protein